MLAGVLPTEGRLVVVGILQGIAVDILGISQLDTVLDLISCLVVEGLRPEFVLARFVRLGRKRPRRFPAR